MADTMAMESPEPNWMPPQDDEDYDPATASAPPGTTAAADVANAEQPLPTVATPDEPGEAAAAAEVSVMERGGRANRRDPTGDEALIGATGNADGVGSFEVIDESGELVKDRFLEFLVN